MHVLRNKQRALEAAAQEILFKDCLRLGPSADMNLLVDDRDKTNFDNSFTGQGLSFHDEPELDDSLYQWGSSTGLDTIFEQQGRTAFAVLEDRYDVGTD